MDRLSILIKEHRSPVTQFGFTNNRSTNDDKIPWKRNWISNWITKTRQRIVGWNKISIKFDCQMDTMKQSNEDASNQSLKTPLEFSDKKSDSVTNWMILWNTEEIHFHFPQVNFCWQCLRNTCNYRQAKLLPITDPTKRQIWKNLISNGHIF